LLGHLDESPWHQLPTTFDHVGTSDPRFFDRFWFAASAADGSGALQFTLGVYQNMNVVDGGFVVIHSGRQYNLRVSRQLRPQYDTNCGPLGFDVIAPFQHVRLSVAENTSGVRGELDWRATSPPQEERHHFARRWGRVLEDYSRYDQIGTLSGWLEIGTERIELHDWWACRDHSWGVRERVGIAEPHTGPVPATDSAGFVFVFFGTDTHVGHLQATARGDITHMTASTLDRRDGTMVEADRLTIDATFIDDHRPRRFDTATFRVREGDMDVVYDIHRHGSAVAMLGLGYGGYNDGLGLGVHRGVDHLEHDIWDVSHPANVVFADGSAERLVHRIQPVTVTRTSPDGVSQGHGSCTFVAEMPLVDGGLRWAARD
jgi:prepilin-type processing-associated H-X9-DG protein